MTSKVTSSTVSEVKFASETDNINPLTLSDIKNGFAGCSGAGIPMTSANFNAVLNWITENIGLQEDIVVETIKGKKYLITKAKDGSTAKIEISKLIEDLRDSGVLTADDFGNGFKFNKKTNKYDVALGKSLTFNENGDIDIKSNPSGGVVINNDGLAELALSKDNGNLLEIRKDGLFYGVSPVIENKKLYVSNTGNDDNPGTKEQPLRTIGAAWRKVSPYQDQDIFIKSGQTHYLSVDDILIGRGGSHKTINPYNDVSDSVIDWETGVYRDHPVIALEQNAEGKHGNIRIFWGSALTIRSCKINLGLQRQSTNQYNSFLMVNEGTVGFNKVGFILPNTPNGVAIKYSLFPGTLLFDNGFVQDSRANKEEYKWITVATGDVIRVTGPTEVVLPNVNSDYIIGNNIVHSLKQRSLVSGVVRDSGVPINVLTNVAGIQSE